MNFRKTSRLSVTISLMSIFFMALVCYAAYNHQGDIDSAVFRAVYPNAVGTKLDSCTTCHSGGSYTPREGEPPRWAVASGVTIKQIMGLI